MSLTVNAVPNAPATPTATVTQQPTCTTPTGTIMITAPTGGSIQYSVGGAYQTSATFANLSPYTYQVTAQNTATGCTSKPLSLTVNSVPNAPMISEVILTQPTCAVPTGTAQINATSNLPLQYSKNGTVWQSSNSFSGLTPAAYTFQVRTTADTTCVTTSASQTINVVPVPSATINYAGSPYTNSGIASVTLTGIMGGIFSSTPGLLLNASTGEVNLAGSIPDNYIVTYTIAASGVCPAFETTDTLQILTKTTLIFVNIANTNPVQNGASWLTAYANLQSGLSAAAALTDSNIQVWVAQGNYKPGTSRSDVFEIPSNVHVYGGFAGTETDLSERNWKTHPVILSGEIGGPQLNDNSNHVVVFRGTDSLTRLDGFRIEKGFAEFVGITQDTDLNDPAVLASGGGILAINKSKGLITNCIITDNRAVGGGGMMLRDSSHMRITQSIIFGNEATFGGAVYVLGGSRPYFENVLMVINKGLGGGLYVNGSQPLLVNTTIASNKDDGKNAGGIYNANSVTTVKNSILWGNSPLQSTLGSNITYSTVEGGYTGVGNSNQNPQFVNPNANGLAPMGTLGDYHLLPCSPAINGGDNSVAPNVDLEGNLRPYPVGLGIVDRGVYESQSSGSSGPANLTVTENITSGTVLKAADKIVATNQVSGATVVYQATKSVTLNPGFSATAGAGNSFQAFIGGCNTAAVTGSQAQK
ncbi:hypothetical protein DR864_29485 (plasmid) [Runella rosea]|uniref:Right handed beta helix domain-containing protein n=1 Tax=Runella rosea TaxID=2259595 RepID=A0A344TTM8_9BACT|nr:hypothetical protein DR864_29485 [Runella rosea]